MKKKMVNSGFNSLLMRSNFNYPSDPSIQTLIFEGKGATLLLSVKPTTILKYIMVLMNI